MTEKKKCVFCGGKGYITRIVTGPHPTIDEKCYYCDGTGERPQNKIIRVGDW